MIELKWTSNDICFDPETKVILGQVTCNGTNDFLAVANGREIGRFVDRETALKHVTHIATTRRNNHA